MRTVSSLYVLVNGDLRLTLLNRTEIRFRADLPFNCNRVDGCSRVRSPSLNAAAPRAGMRTCPLRYRAPIRCDKRVGPGPRGILGHHALPPASMFGYYLSDLDV